MAIPSIQMATPSIQKVAHRIVRVRVLLRRASLRASLRVLSVLCMGGLWGCLSCQSSSEHTAPVQDSLRVDSLSLRVAISPTEACLPFYYAERVGVYDSLGLEVHFHHLATMEDCDTALLRQHVQVAASDLARALCLHKEGFPLRIVAQMGSTLTLYSVKERRLNEVKQLRERLLGMERHSESDYRSDLILKGTGIDPLELFRIQLNSHRLRLDMLDKGLIDAAFLDEPYATLAHNKGARRIGLPSKAEESWAALLTSSPVLSSERVRQQIHRLIEGYQLACRQLQESPHSKALLKDLLRQDYAITPQEIDEDTVLQGTLRFPEMRAPKSTHLQTAKEWLIARQWVKKSLATDSLIDTTLFSRP